MRFMYCAAAICYILQDFSAINMNSAVQYVLNSMVRAQAVSYSDRAYDILTHLLVKVEHYKMFTLSTSKTWIGLSAYLPH